MTAEEDQRGDDFGRRLTDNQLLVKFKKDEEDHKVIEANISANHDNIANLVDELTAFRSETNQQFMESRRDRDQLKYEITAAHNENREQFAGIGECINELKAWQYDQDRKQQDDRQHRTERERMNDQVYAEMLDNFKFTKKLRKVIYSAIGGAAVIFGLTAAGIELWHEMKHLFQGSP